MEEKTKRSSASRKKTNKVNEVTYFEIGVLDSFTYDELHKYITEVNINNSRNLEKVIKFIHKNLGKDVIIAWNEITGIKPDNIDEIKVKETKLKYNK